MSTGPDHAEKNIPGAIDRKAPTHRGQHSNFNLYGFTHSQYLYLNEHFVLIDLSNKMERVDIHLKVGDLTSEVNIFRSLTEGA